MTAWVKLGEWVRARSLWVLAGLVLAVAAFQALWIPDVTPSGKDTTYYLEGAAGLAGGDGFRHVAHEGRPPIRLFSPGQSLWLAGAWRISGRDFPANYRWLAAAQLGALVASLGVLAWTLRRQGAGVLVTGCSVLAVGLSPMGTAYAHFLWSEPVFCLLSFLFLHRLRLVAGSQDLRGWLLLGLIGLGLVVWRKAGIGLVAGAGLAALVGTRPDWRGALAVLGPGTAFGIGWAWYGTVAARAAGVVGGDQAQGLADSWARLGGAGGYLRLLGSHLREFLSGLQFVDALFGVLLRSSDAPQVPMIPAALALGVGLGFLWLMVQGVVADRSPGGRAVAVASGVYLLETLVWVWDTGGRAVLPLASVALGWVWRGAREWIPKNVQPVIRCGVAAAALSLLAANAWQIAHYRAYADDRAREVTAFVRTAVPSELEDGDLAVDVELPALLVRDVTGRRLAHLPRVDEFRGAWVPRRPGAPDPQWFLARAPLFTNGVVTAPSGTYRAVARSPDGTLVLGQRAP